MNKHLENVLLSGFSRIAELMERINLSLSPSLSSLSPPPLSLNDLQAWGPVNPTMASCKWKSKNLVAQYHKSGCLSLPSVYAGIPKTGNGAKLSSLKAPPRWLTFSNEVPCLKGSRTFQNSTKSWGLNIQTHEHTMGITCAHHSRYLSGDHQGSRKVTKKDSKYFLNTWKILFIRPQVNDGMD